jgi:uncharacterized repeat protein (TIGR03803 family)
MNISYRVIGVRRLMLATFVFCAAMTVFAPAQVVYETLFSFDGSDGHGPQYMFLIQGTDGNFYGTTQEGGTYDAGVVFSVTPEGTETVLHDFGSQNDDGAAPYAGLVQATDGNFYGTTFGGGAYNYGTVFKITPEGAVTILYSFCVQGYPCADGRVPFASLIQGIDGNLYGTTPAGGAHDAGTAFRVTLGGTLTTLYNFCAQLSCADGDGPTSALVEGADGDFYGVAGGGALQYGAVFKITPAGSEMVVQSFDGADGVGPAGLVASPDGNFYGTAEGGGAHGAGTVFKVTPSGKLTTVYSFRSKRGQNGGCIDGGTPLVAPALGSDGYYFGMTQGGGDGSSIYGVTPTGQFRTLYGWHPGGGTAGMVQGTDGIFYGTTENDGDYDHGTVFSLNVGLGPFVKTNPLAGRAGLSITILGTNLTGATSVTFNGTPATFTVASSSEITTNVPTGATTGRVRVVTPTGMLTSNLPFIVTQ